MPRPYSVDLRERPVARVMAGETVPSVAPVLQVSVASVVKWPQRYRRTGIAAPGPMHGHRPRLLLPQAWVMQKISGADRPQAVGIHRRDLDPDHHGAAPRVGTTRPAPRCPYAHAQAARRGRDGYHQ